MNSTNIKQWWENTYRHHLMQKQEQQQINFESSLAVLPDSTNSKELLKIAALQQTLDENDIFVANNVVPSANIGVLDYENFDNLTYMRAYDRDRDENVIPSITLLFIAISYGLVVFVGVLGNATLLLTLCSASSARLRNPLLLAVCIADLLVTGISAPLTLLNLAMNHKTKTLSLELCKVIDFIQATPVAASTLSFFLLSLDRYVIVKHPCLEQIRQRRYLHVSLAVFSWLTSAIVSVPFLFVYKIVAKTIVMEKSIVKTSPSSTLMAVTTAFTPTADFPNVSICCHSDPGANPVFVVFILIHTFIVFIIPGLGVLLNHYGVRRKLCALSLTARAAHGELPLPMPILRRQTGMVIVTGMTNAHQAGCGGTTGDTSNDENIQMQNLNPQRTPNNQNVILSKNPISPRAMREIREHSQRQRTAHTTQRGRSVATPGIPLPQTSTLRSRRHLANMLIGSAIIFIACWVPHVFCIIYKIIGYREYCRKSSRYFNLLLGYMYSALSPIIYWALNHNSLRQSPCAPIIRLRSVQKFLRTRFRQHPVPPAPSSTNEAQLGAFNPKLIKRTPKQYRTQASSHYLY